MAIGNAIFCEITRLDKGPAAKLADLGDRGCQIWNRLRY